MRMKKILSIVLAIVLLASVVPLAITPAAATYPYEEKIPFAGEDNELTKEELVNDAILPYMLGEGDFALDDVGDAAWIYAYWDGKPKMLTDQCDREVTFYRPVERIVSTFPSHTRQTVILGGMDKLVGVSRHYTVFSSMCPESKMLALWAYPELKELTEVGSRSSPNLEQTIILKPDAVFVATYSGSVTASEIQERTGIPCIAVAIVLPYEGKGGVFEGYRLMGKVLDNEERAEELISFTNEEFDKVRAVTSEISDDERVKVYFCSGITRASGTAPGIIEKAGGISVARGISDTSVSKEQIIEWNPDIILIHRLRCSATDIGIVLNDPLLQSVNAVNNSAVYCTPGGWYGQSPATGVVEALYMAKLFYPDKFKDMDMEEEGNRILERFYGVDGLYTHLQEACDLYRWE